MNFLAHAYLSFHEPDILAGNMMADFVRGKQMLSFSPAVQEGIRLHRAIDTFTDCHPETRRASGYLRKACGRYSGVFLDVIYDHFLATDPRYFTPDTLKSFSEQTYQTLTRFEAVFPPRFKQVFHYMQTQDWLTGYRETEKVGFAFSGIYRRASYLSESDQALRALHEHYEALRGCSRAFVPEVIGFARKSLEAAGKRNLCP